jgi:hypothetical protein
MGNQKDFYMDFQISSNIGNSELNIENIDSRYLYQILKFKIINFSINKSIDIFVYYFYKCFFHKYVYALVLSDRGEKILSTSFIFNTLRYISLVFVIIFCPLDMRYFK